MAPFYKPPRSFLKIAISRPQFTWWNQNLWGGAWELIFFKCSPGDSDRQLWLRTTCLNRPWRHIPEMQFVMPAGQGIQSILCLLQPTGPVTVLKRRRRMATVGRLRAAVATVWVPCGHKRSGSRNWGSMLSCLHPEGKRWIFYPRCSEMHLTGSKWTTYPLQSRFPLNQMKLLWLVYQCFSNLFMSRNCPGILLTCRFWISRSGVGPRSSVTNKLPGD